MRLTIPPDAARVVTSLQTRVAEVHYACHDERGCVRPTHDGGRAVYCEHCNHKGKATCIHAKPNRAAELAAAQQMGRYRNIVVAAVDPDALRYREHLRNFSDARVCGWEGCEAPISNRNVTGYCRSHCAVLRQRRLSEAKPPLSRSQAARSDGRTCTWPGCATPITNRATYCRTHSVIIAQQQLHMMRQEESKNG